MAFSTSNTNPLFGGNKAAQQSGNLFGQPAQPTASFFGQPSQQPQGNIFGQSTQQQPASQLGQPQQQTGFGQPAQQQQTTGMFGQSAQQQQPATGPFGQQPSGGLFGQSTQPQTSGHIFGQSTIQQPLAGGLFGQSSQPQTHAQQPNSLLGGPVFGSANGQQQSNFFGSTLQQPQQSGVGISTTQSSGFLLTKSSKFNDLPDDMKRIFEDMDSYIQGRVQISKELHKKKLGEEPKKAQELIRPVQKDLVDATTMVHNDLRLAKDLRGKVEQTVQDTIMATKIVDGFKNPQQFGSYLKDHATFPLEFFMRVTESMKQRLGWYKSAIEQIERKLNSSSQHTTTPQCIGATLQAQNATFLALANKTATLDAELQKIKILYVQLWRAKTGSMRDPFNELDRTLEGDDYGIVGLQVR